MPTQKVMFREIRGRNLTGTLKSYDPNTGYGFIIPDDGGGDVFVHGRAIDRAGLGPLTKGQRLSYDLLERIPTGKGFSAENLRVILPSSGQ